MTFGMWRCFLQGKLYRQEKYQGTSEGRNLEESVKDKVLAERDIFTKEREDWDIFTIPFSSLRLVGDPTLASTELHV